MEKDLIKKMEKIDNDLVMGNVVSKEDIDFYNRNWETMLDYLKECYEYWKYHTHKI